MPGHQLVFVGTANRGQGQGTHRAVFTVTDMVKQVDGIDTVVVWDRDPGRRAGRGRALALGAGRRRQRLEPG
jgi:hypothetical protein